MPVGSVRKGAQVTKGEIGRLGKAVRSEDSLEALVELRNVLADAMDNSKDARSIAALSRQITEVLSRIDALRPEEGKGKGELTVVEQLMERRKKGA